jgi:hypothetical protein
MPSAGNSHWQRVPWILRTTQCKAGRASDPGGATLLNPLAAAGKVTTRELSAVTYFAALTRLAARGPDMKTRERAPA